MNSSILRIVAASTCLVTATVAADKPKILRDKLQIVFLMGQSNMVGMADIGTACYLTQPLYVPPREVIFQKSDIFSWNNLFWQGVRYYQGPPELKRELEGLIKAREASRAMWRGRTKNWKAEWGEKPVIKNRDDMYAFLDKKAEEEGIYQRMAEILSGPENRFPMAKAFEEVINRDHFNAEHLERVRDIYLNGTKTEDFDSFREAIAEAKNKKTNKRSPEETRTWIAQLGTETVKLPIAKRTHIFDHGAFAASNAPSNTTATAHGPLSIGWGAGPTMIGPEYAIGVTLEKLVDAPILLVKCAWGNTAVAEAWRPASLDGIETPAEKAQREAWNAVEAALAKEEGREPKLRSARQKRDKLAWCWSMALPAVKKVLENPGAYHPEYDPAKGHEIAGMVWFQGYSDLGNEAYGEQLTEMFKWFRNEIHAPNMPIVCGTVGVDGYNHMAYEGQVNGGMVQAANSPELKGSMDVVNTARYFPHELAMLIQTLHAAKEHDLQEHYRLKALHEKINSNQGFHYYGSAKFFLLAGDAFARSLANLLAGGEPVILDHKEAANGAGLSPEIREWKRLEGSWKIIDMEAAGQPVPALKGRIWNFENHKVSIPTNGGNPMMFRAELDPDARPKQMTMKLVDRVGEAVFNQAIYSLEGDTLKVCLTFNSLPGRKPPFPAAFQTDAGNPMTTLCTLKRVAAGGY